MLELIEDLGMLYPKLTSKQKSHFGLYKCICGTKFKAHMASIKNGTTSSCGCYRKQRITEVNKSHGQTTTLLYKVYSSMKDRCLNQKSRDFKYYGARGIIVCLEWRNSFETFYQWAISNGYIEGLSIDRVNNNGNYEPNNCRWATKSTQSRNQRILQVNNTSGYKGVRKNGKNWYASITVNYKVIYLGTFSTAIDAAIAYNNYIDTNKLEHTKNKDMR